MSIIVKDNNENWQRRGLNGYYAKRLSVDTSYWRKKFIQDELMPGINAATSTEKLEEAKQRGDRYLFTDVGKIIMQAKEQNIITISGSYKNWHKYRVTYKNNEISYGVLWHDIQYALIDAGFEHVGKHTYIYDVTKPPPKIVVK